MRPVFRPQLFDLTWPKAFDIVDFVNKMKGENIMEDFVQSDELASQIEAYEAERELTSARAFDRISSVN